MDNGDQVVESENISALVDVIATCEESTQEIKEEIPPCELVVHAANENESTPIFNEYELPTAESETR